MLRINYFQIIEKISSSIDECKIYDLPVDLKTVFSGGTIKFKIPVIKKCDECNGTGIKDYGEECIVCHGTGRVSNVIKTDFGTIVEKTTCPRCFGTGRINMKFCEKCNGTGKVTEYEEVKKTLRNGISDNELILLRKKDEFNPTIYGRIRIYDDFFEISGKDIIGEVKINIDDVLHNSKKVIKIPHPNKTIKLTVEELVKKEKQIFKGLGIPDRRGSSGNMILYSRIIR